MFFKSVIMTYANSLEGEPRRDRDPIAAHLPRAAWADFRQRKLEEISEAVKYCLDAEAADYADTLRETLMEGYSDKERSLPVRRVMQEVPLPHDLIWVEHDHLALMRNRAARGFGEGEDIDRDEFGRRAFLIDNRSEDVVKMMMFRDLGSRSQTVIDPTYEVHFDKLSDGSGRASFSSLRPVPHRHMIEFFQGQGYSKAEFDRIETQELNDITYDMAIPYMVFAEMNSKDHGLDLSTRESLTGAEKKTARKFGKSWMTDRLRTHITIHIGPSLRRHIDEKAARLSHERAVASGRASPTEHWVAEHERRYKSGKVVLVRAHRRGAKPDDSLPRLVKGPRA